MWRRRGWPVHFSDYISIDCRDVAVTDLINPAIIYILDELRLSLCLSLSVTPGVWRQLNSGERQLMQYSRSVWKMEVCDLDGHRISRWVTHSPTMGFNVQTEMRFWLQHLPFPEGRRCKKKLLWSKSHFSLYVKAKQRRHIVWFHKHKIELKYV